MTKKEYVKTCLEPAFKHAGLDIESLDYQTNPSIFKDRNGNLHYMEEIVITYDGGWKKYVNVEMDSFSGMLKDVVKTL